VARTLVRISPLIIFEHLRHDRYSLLRLILEATADRDAIASDHEQEGEAFMKGSCGLQSGLGAGQQQDQKIQKRLRTM
jgi:hypothetical protein